MRTDLRKIAKARLADAVALRQSRRYDSAVYLCGYTVEAVLKARICRALDWSGYPETRAEFQAYASFRTHDLDVLLRLSGAEARIRAGYLPQWSVVSGWTPEVRYRPIGRATRANADDMIAACRLFLTIL